MILSRFLEGHQPTLRLTYPEAHLLAPFLLIIGVADFEETIAWHEEVGLEEWESIDSPDNFQTFHIGDFKDNRLQLSKE